MWWKLGTFDKKINKVGIFSTQRTARSRSTHKKAN